VNTDAGSCQGCQGSIPEGAGVNHAVISRYRADFPPGNSTFPKY
jgi:hypothetical protein